MPLAACLPASITTSHRRGPGLRWLLLGALAVAAAACCPRDDAPPAVPAVFAAHARILFQGDSITDGGRGRSSDPNHVFGQSYAYLIAARIGSAAPERGLLFFNRGISGNRVSDLAARWRADALDLHPDLLSILVGVNDVTHALDGSKPTTPEQFAATYDALLARTVQALPHVQLILGEPFLLPVGKNADHYADRLATMRRYQAVVASLGAKYHAPVIAYQRMFDAACLRAPAAYWVWDGVHPTAAGHGLMEQAWLATAATLPALQPAAAPAP
jgi:lysophospholipase L1-like esterase